MWTKGHASVHAEAEDHGVRIGGSGETRVKTRVELELMGKEDKPIEMTGQSKRDGR
jgi:hypothetical protein